MKLTKEIIRYWWHQINLPNENFTEEFRNSSMWDWHEGLLIFNTKWGMQRYMSFWYILNHEWYKMNDVKYAYTNCKEQYSEPDDEIFEEN